MFKNALFSFSALNCLCITAVNLKFGTFCIKQAQDMLVVIKHNNKNDNNNCKTVEWEYFPDDLNAIAEFKCVEFIVLPALHCNNSARFYDEKDIKVV